MITGIAALIVGGFVVRFNTASYVQNQAKELAAAPNNAATTAQLNALKRYANSHSGATVTVHLTTAYNEAMQVYQQAEIAATAPSSALYAAAQAACAGHAISTVQAQCNEQYIETHSPPTAATTAIPQPIEADYSYHFLSPFLTTDLSTAFWALAFILILVLAVPVLRPQPYF
jgi:hypothetical protein